MGTDAIAIPLRLEVVTAPAGTAAVRMPSITGERETILGRGEGCDVHLPDPTVSRRHAAIIHRGTRWMIIDRNSRQGTYLNGNPLSPETPAALVENDLVSIGPYTFRVDLGRQRALHTVTFDDSSDASQRVERLGPDQISRMAQHRLDLLINCAAEITASTDEAALACAVLKCALDGSGFQRGALLRQLASSDDVEIVAQQTRDGAGAGNFQFSRTLLREANGGQMARLATLNTPGSGSSVYELGITAAICAPIMLNALPVTYLYLDTRGKRATVAGDATAFIQVISRLYGLALMNINRLELKVREDEFHRVLTAAREVQKLIVPPERGTAGALRYAVRMKPGRYVAGDLFDFFRLGDERQVAAFLGDVCGEGIEAAMLMAATQPQLHALLLHHGQVTVALNAVNRYLSQKCAPGKFVSLWIGRFDLNQGTVEFVDAGHGHWLHKPHGQPARMIRAVGGLVLGVDQLCVYQGEYLAFEPGDRLVLYSDGLVEQRGPDGDRVGLDRVRRVIDDSRSAEEDVELLFAEIERFARRADFDDDTTVASIEWVA